MHDPLTVPPTKTALIGLGATQVLFHLLKWP